MRIPNDEKLGWLAKRLAELKFTTTLTPESSALIQGLTARNSVNKLSGVNMLFNLSKSTATAFVRHYIGGKYRTLATCGVDWMTAARLSDMVTLKMGAFRLRTMRPIPDDEFNFSRAQAQADWLSEREIAEVISQMESHFRELGALVSEQQPIRQAPPSIEARLVNIEALLIKLVQQKPL